MRSGGTPAACERLVGRAVGGWCWPGWMTSVRVSPMLARWLHSSNASMNARPAARPPTTPNENTAPGPLRQVALRARRGAGGRRRPAQRTHDDAGSSARGTRRRLRALARWASIRCGSVSTPCRSRKALNGDSVGPTSRSCSARRRVQKRVLAEVRPPRQPAVRRHRLGHPREVAVAPVEPPGLDHHTAERGAVAADELRRRVHDDVGAPLDRPAQVGRRHVSSRRRAGCRRAWATSARPSRSAIDARRVGDHLGVDQLRVGSQRRREVGRLGRRRRTWCRRRSGAA